MTLVFYCVMGKLRHTLKLTEEQNEALGLPYADIIEIEGKHYRYNGMELGNYRYVQVSILPLPISLFEGK